LYELPADVTWPCWTTPGRAAVPRRLNPGPNRSPIYEIHHAEVIEALRDAPTVAISRPPVKLFIAA